MDRGSEEERFRRIFRAAHADHPGCSGDEWLHRACRLTDGSPADRPVIWSRRNGPWHRVEILWVGAAPGNAGGKGAGAMGAHGTRIPFGGDIAGANVDLLLGSIGLTRNETFIVAALNQLPARGGGEPTVGELNAPVGAYPTSLHLLRDTIVAAGPRLVVALGTIAIRATLAAARTGAACIDGARTGGVQAVAARTGAARIDGEPAPAERARREPARGTAARTPITLPTTARIAKSGIVRGEATTWPEAFPPGTVFLDAWREAWGDASPFPDLLWLTHPSAQNMSPYAGVDTAFHGRMVEARDALRRAVAARLGRRPPGPGVRPPPPGTGIYALQEWREQVGPRHAELDRLWREKGV